MMQANPWAAGLPYILRLPWRGTAERVGAFGIVANVLEADRAFRSGAKAWLAAGTGGTGMERFKWIAASRGGRKISKWAPTARFHNFRAAWIPEHLEDDVWYFTGTRQEMEEMAARLNQIAMALRVEHPNRRH